MGVQDKCINLKHSRCIKLKFYLIKLLIFSPHYTLTIGLDYWMQLKQVQHVTNGIMLNLWPKDRKIAYTLMFTLQRYLSKETISFILLFVFRFIFIS